MYRSDRTCIPQSLVFISIKLNMRLKSIQVSLVSGTGALGEKKQTKICLSQCTVSHQILQMLSASSIEKVNSSTNSAYSLSI